MVAVGAAGMAQGVSDPAIPGTAMNVSGSGVLEVLDSTGNALVHFEPLRDYSHVVVYSDCFTDGESYTLTLGGESQTVQMTTDSTGGMGFGGGRGGFGGGRGDRGEPPKTPPEGIAPEDAPDAPPDGAPPEDAPDAPPDGMPEDAPGDGKL